MKTRKAKVTKSKKTVTGPNNFEHVQGKIQKLVSQLKDIHQNPKHQDNLFAPNAQSEPIVCAITKKEIASRKSLIQPREHEDSTKNKLKNHYITSTPHYTKTGNGFFNSCNSLIFSPINQDASNANPEPKNNDPQTTNKFRTNLEPIPVGEAASHNVETRAKTIKSPLPQNGDKILPKTTPRSKIPKPVATPKGDLEREATKLNSLCNKDLNQKNVHSLTNDTKKKAKPKYQVSGKGKTITKRILRSYESQKKKKEISSDEAGDVADENSCNDLILASNSKQVSDKIFEGSRETVTSPKNKVKNHNEEPLLKLKDQPVSECELNNVSASKKILAPRKDIGNHNCAISSTIIREHKLKEIEIALVPVQMCIKEVTQEGQMTNLLKEITTKALLGKKQKPSIEKKNGSIFENNVPLGRVTRSPNIHLTTRNLLNEFGISSSSGSSGDSLNIRLEDIEGMEPGKFTELRKRRFGRFLRKLEEYVQNSQSDQTDEIDVERKPKSPSKNRRFDSSLLKVKKCYLDFFSGRARLGRKPVSKIQKTRDLEATIAKIIKNLSGERRDTSNKNVQTSGNDRSIRIPIFRKSSIRATQNISKTLISTSQSDLISNSEQSSEPGPNIFDSVAPGDPLNQFNFTRHSPQISYDKNVTPWRFSGLAPVSVSGSIVNVKLGFIRSENQIGSSLNEQDNICPVRESNIISLDKTLTEHDNVNNTECNKLPASDESEIVNMPAKRISQIRINGSYRQSSSSRIYSSDRKKSKFNKRRRPKRLQSNNSDAIGQKIDPVVEQENLSINCHSIMNGIINPETPQHTKQMNFSLNGVVNDKMKSSRKTQSNQIEELQLATTPRLYINLDDSPPPRVSDRNSYVMASTNQNSEPEVPEKENSVVIPQPVMNPVDNVESTREKQTVESLNRSSRFSKRNQIATEITEQCNRNLPSLENTQSNTISKPSTSQVSKPKRGTSHRRTFLREIDTSNILPSDGNTRSQRVRKPSKYIFNLIPENMDFDTYNNLTEKIIRNTKSSNSKITTTKKPSTKGSKKGSSNDDVESLRRETVNNPTDNNNLFPIVENMEEDSPEIIPSINRQPENELMPPPKTTKPLATTSLSKRQLQSTTNSTADSGIETLNNQSKLSLTGKRTKKTNVTKENNTFEPGVSSEENPGCSIVDNIIMEKDSLITVIPEESPCKRHKNELAEDASFTNKDEPLIPDTVPPITAFRKMDNIYLYEIFYKPDQFNAGLMLLDGGNIKGRCVNERYTQNFFVVRGQCTIYRGSNIIHRKCGDTFSIPKGTVYAILNTYPRRRLVLSYYQIR
ncbi:hypothetical protein ABEB36_002359 [Hypothenemus hampei]|uniref:Centromere protein C n=1 Tax=Hypothenemus hampei TaxID=57062 RepID=A0ABD1F5H3_HYPHA